MAMKMQVAVFWVVTPNSHVVGYQHSGGSCSHHLHPENWSILVIYYPDSFALFLTAFMFLNSISSRQ